VRSLKQTLDRFYREYDFKERVKHDPIEFPHRYSDPEDIEVAGFIASSFAYGKAEVFKSVIEAILQPCGRHPARFFLNFDPKREGRHFRAINYRFNKGSDVLCLVYMVSVALQRWGSLRNIFYSYYKPDHEDTWEALKGFISLFRRMDTSVIYGKNVKPYGLTQFFPLPEKGSPCKRMNLFLRWMVRKGDIDFGIWDKIPPSKLIIPLDTHIARIAKCLGLTKRTSTDIRTAREITASLRRFDPIDPLKYDFALCHQGISGQCRGKRFKDICSTCYFSRVQ
jgi:uncharacterized protein (TIGR02757 family)